MEQVKQIVDRVVQVLDNGGQTQVTFSAGDWQALIDLVAPAETPVDAPAQEETPTPAVEVEEKPQEEHNPPETEETKE
jgi:hypothetical protein